MQGFSQINTVIITSYRSLQGQDLFYIQFFSKLMFFLHFAPSKIHETWYTKVVLSLVKVFTKKKGITFNCIVNS